MAIGGIAVFTLGESGMRSWSRRSVRFWGNAKRRGNGSKSSTRV